VTDSGLTEQAEELYQLASDAPNEVAIEDLKHLLECGDQEVGRIAIATFGKVAKADPDAAAPATDLVSERLSAEDPEICELISRAMIPLAETRPQAAAKLTDELLAVISDWTDQLAAIDLLSSADEIPQKVIDVFPAVVLLSGYIEESEPGSLVEVAGDFQRLLRVNAYEAKVAGAMGLADISKTNPDAVVDAVEELLTCLEPTEPIEDPELRAWLGESRDGDHTQLHTSAMVAIERLSATHPHSVRASVDFLPEYLSRQEERFRWMSAQILANLADECPEDVSSHAEELAHHLNDTAMVRLNASYALDILSQHVPEKVRPFADDMVTLIDDDQTLIRENVLMYLKFIVREYPDAVHNKQEKIRPRLDDESKEVRKNAARTLLTLGSTHANRLNPKLS